MADEVRIDADDLDRLGDRMLTGAARLGEDFDDVLTLYGLRLQNYAEGRFKREYSPSSSRGRSFLQNRTGAGRRSFVYEVTGAGTERELTFATLQDYVATHEFGAEIRPVQATYLTIPMDDNLNPSGEPYETASEAIELGAFFFEPDGPGGSLFIAREIAGGADLEFLFWLTQGPVEIPRRLGVGEYIDRPAVQDQLLTDLVSAITTVVAEVLR